jgi:DNA-binding Lrp family transcriptional regulator
LRKLAVRAAVQQYLRVDALDRAIIDVLAVEGRIPNVELADRVRLTPGPCLRRGAAAGGGRCNPGYRAVIDPDAVGRGFSVMVDVDLERAEQDTVIGFEEAISALDEVDEVHRLFGSPDYLVRVSMADIEAYEQFFTSKVMTIPGIQKVRSRFTMKVVKAAP